MSFQFQHGFELDNTGFHGNRAINNQRLFNWLTKS